MQITPSKPPSGWKHRRDIPNEEGFKLQVILDDNSIVNTQVIKEPITFCHTLENVDFFRIQGWR